MSEEIKTINDNMPLGASDKYKEMVEIFYNHSIDHENVDKAIRNTITKSFTQLYEHQVSLDDIHRYDFKMSDLLLMTRSPMDKSKTYYPRRYTLTINNTLIDEVHCLDATKHGTYNMILSQDDIAKRHDELFIDRTFKLFIDGEEIKSAEIIDKNHHILLLIDVFKGSDPNQNTNVGIDNVKFDKLMEEDALITVFLMPINCKPSETINVLSDFNWIQLDYNEPVPTTSIIPVITDVVHHNITCTLFYPNIYRIDGIPEGESVNIDIIHRDGTWAEYTNQLHLYHEYVHDIIGKYMTGTIPEFIKEYYPSEFPIDIDDEGFRQSKLFPNKMLYDINKLDEYTLTDYHIFIQYMYLKLRNKIRLYIDMSKVNLESRIRHDTLTESNEMSPMEKHFDEPRYLISLRKSIFGPNLAFRLYLDNYLLTPYQFKYYENIDWYHFYIPCDMIKEDSILEIEKYRVFKYDKTIKASEELVKIEIPENIKYINVWNIYIHDIKSNAYVGRNAYEIVAYNKILDEYVDINPEGYSTLTNSFYIRFTDYKYIDNDVVVHLTSTPDMKMSRDENGNDVGVLFGIVDDMMLSHDKIRIYKNNRLAPIEYLYTKSDDPGSYNGIYEMIVSMGVTDDDLFVVDMLPISFKKEFEIIGPFEHNGYINTGDSLSLPIDLKWYDIFVNGIKLNKSNIKIISPNKFMIKGINTCRNLQIFLRQDGYAHTIFNRWNETIDDKIFNIPEIKQAIFDENGLLDDELSDIVEDYVESIIIKHLNFLDEILKYIFINPNTQQLHEGIKDAYPDFFDEYDILWLDCNTNPDAELKTIINSNVRYSIMKNGQYRYGFTPLHVGNHMDARIGEYLCDPITGLPGIKNEDETVFVGANINRMQNHKVAFNNMLMLDGIPHKSIYQLEFDENTTSKLVTKGHNILDSGTEYEIVGADIPVDKVAISLDIDILEIGHNNVLRLSDYEPNVNIEYTVDGNTVSKTLPFSALDKYVFEVNGNGFTLNKITLTPQADNDDTMDHLKIIIYSILIAF